ncbi:MAG: hypothetical protein SVX38_06115 [Chloroflexota bacterium]|nr:hypothetical protein [Chloroflexota bacterium]
MIQKTLFLDNPEMVKGEAQYRYESDWQMQSLLTCAENERSKIESLPVTEASLAACALLHSFYDMAKAYYMKARYLLEIESEPKFTKHERTYYRHATVRRLAEGWEHVGSVISTALNTSYSTSRKDPSLTKLAQVVQQAQDNLAFSEMRERFAVMPHFGARHFEIVHFHYAPFIALIGVPRYYMHVPWGWSVVWHELAGSLVREKKVQQAIQSFVNTFDWHDWEETYRGLNREGWITELVEDAVSVLALGATMYDTLEVLLHQHYLRLDQPEDDRHPVPTIRLEVAHGLLHRMGVKSGDTDDEHARQISDWLYGLRSQLVRKLFTEKDAEATTELAPKMADGERLPDSTPAHRLIAAARTAFMDNPACGENVCKSVFGEPRPRALAAIPREYSEATERALEASRSFFREEIQPKTKWEELEVITLYDEDRALIWEVGAHDHGGQPTQNDSNAEFEVFGYYHSGYRHSFEFKLTHKHQDRQFLDNNWRVSR